MKKYTMRKYTIYTDEAGKAYAVFDDMAANFKPLTAIGALTPVKTGRVKDFVGLNKALKKFQCQEMNINADQNLGIVLA